MEFSFIDVMWYTAYCHIALISFQRMFTCLQWNEPRRTVKKNGRNFFSLNCKLICIKIDYKRVRYTRRFNLIMHMSVHRCCFFSVPFFFTFLWFRVLYNAFKLIAIECFVTGKQRRSHIYQKYIRTNYFETQMNVRLANGLFFVFFFFNCLLCSIKLYTNLIF